MVPVFMGRREWMWGGHRGFPAHSANENLGQGAELSWQVDGLNITEGVGFCQESRGRGSACESGTCQRHSPAECVEKVTFLRCVRLPKSSRRPNILLDKQTGGGLEVGAVIP